jgi:hypothetical protein
LGKPLMDMKWMFFGKRRSFWQKRNRILRFLNTQIWEEAKLLAKKRNKKFLIQILKYEAKLQKRE